MIAFPVVSVHDSSRIWVVETTGRRLVKRPRVFVNEFVDGFCSSRFWERNVAVWLDSRVYREDVL